MNDGYVEPSRKAKRITPQNLKHLRSKRIMLFMEDPHCFYCRKHLTLGEATLDHYVPKAKGGTNRWENLRIACDACNQKKACRAPSRAVLLELAEGNHP